jgi:hypothetical protein
MEPPGVDAWAAWHPREVAGGAWTCSRPGEDEADLAQVLPTLDTPARAGLADAMGGGPEGLGGGEIIELAHPGHHWIHRVRAA